MRPNLSDKTVKLISKIQESEVNSYESASDVINRALELLWQHEKSLAYAKLGSRITKFYEENPNEAKLSIKLQGLE